MKNRLPSMPFFVGDYLSSGKVESLSLEEEAVYLRLLFYQWQEGFLPNNFQTLAKYTKCNARKFKRVWGVIGEQFQKRRGGTRLVNKKVEDVRNETLAIIKRKSQGGKNSAEQRKIERKSLTESPTKTPAKSPPTTKSKPKPDSSTKSQKKPPSDPRRRPVSDFIVKTYREDRGVDLITDAGSWKQLDSLLKKTPATTDDLCAAWRAFLSSDDEFHRKQGNPLRYFCGQINAFMPRNGNGEPEAPKTEEEIQAIAEMKVKTMQRARDDWDLDYEKHQHDRKCQDGKVCPYVPSKRPYVPTTGEILRRLTI